MYCFGRFCLICIKNTENLINLDVNIVLSDEYISLIRILTEINAELSTFDEIFPKYICSPCKKDLLTAYAFHKRCRKSIDNLTNYAVKLNHLHLPANKQNADTKKTYTFGYNAITSRHMLFKIKKLTKHNYKTRKSNVRSISAQSNLTTIPTNYSESISDRSTVILKKTENCNLKNTIDKLARYLKITDLDKLDEHILDANDLEHKNLEQNILDQNNLEPSGLDVVQDENTALINQKFEQIIGTTAQNLNENDLFDLDHEFYETFNVTDDYFVKEENPLDLGSCDFSDISSASLNNQLIYLKREIKDERIKSENDATIESTNLDVNAEIDTSSSSKNDTYIDLTTTSNNNYIDLTVSPNKNNILQDVSNSPFRSKNIRTEQKSIDLTVSPSKGFNTLDQRSEDVGKFVNHSPNSETNLDLKLTGSNNSIIIYSDISDFSDEETSNPSALSNVTDERTNCVLEPNVLDHDSDLNQSFETLINSIELDIKQELIDEVKDTTPNKLEHRLDLSNDNLNVSIDLEVKSELTPPPSIIPEKITENILEPNNLEPTTVVLDRSKDDLNNTLELELKPEVSVESDRFSAGDYVFPEFYLDDLNLEASSKSSELDIEEHPIKFDPEEMQEIKIEIEEILQRHANLQTDTSKNNNNKRKLDINEPGKDLKRSRQVVTAKQVPDLASFSSKIIENAQIALSKDVKDLKRIREPNDPNVKKGPKTIKKIPDIASFSSKINANAQLLLSKDVNDPEILKEPNDPNSELSSKIKDPKSINPTSTKCDSTTLLSTTINDPNLEPKKTPYSPNMKSKWQKSPKSVNTNLIYIEVKDTIFMHKKAQKPNDPNVSHQTIVPKINVPKSTNPVDFKSRKDPNNFGKDATSLPPPETNDPNLKTRSPESPNKKVLIQIKLKKPYIFKQNDPNIQELELFDLNDPKLKTLDSKEATLCHNEDSPKKLVPKDAHETISDLKDPNPLRSQDIKESRSNKKDPNDSKIKDFDSNKKFKSYLDENKHLRDSKHLSPKKIDLKEPKTNIKDPNDPTLINKDPDDPKSSNKNPNESKSNKMDPTVLKSNKRDPTTFKSNKKDPNDPKSNINKDPDDPKLQNLNSNVKPKKMNPYVLLSTKKLDFKESRSVCKIPNDPKAKNLELNDPQTKKMGREETKLMNDGKYLSPKKIELKESNPNDPKPPNLVPNDPRNRKLSVILSETKHINETKDSFDIMEPRKNSNDQKTQNLDPTDPKLENLISEELQGNESNQQLSPKKIDPIGLSLESKDPNDPKLGPTDPELANKCMNESKCESSEAISEKTSKSVDTDANPSTSNKNSTFTPHTCRFCTSAYETGFQLKCHIFEVHKDKFNKCAVCKATFPNKHKLLRHTEMYHSDSTNTFRNNVPDLRDIHFRNYDRPAFENYDYPGFERPYLGGMAGSSSGPVSFRDEYFRSGNCFRNDDFRTRRFGPYNCIICNKSFFSPFNLNKHYNLVHYR